MRQEVRPYTEKELEAFKQYYTPQQIEALEASENSIDLKDLEEQAVKRNDPFMLRYFDDLSKLDPLLDNKELPEVTHAPKMRFMEKEEFLNRVVDKMRYGGMTIPEMSYAIQKSTLSDKMKAGLKTLNRWKGSHKEDAVKEILWKFVPKAANRGITADGQKTIAALFKEVEQLDLRAVKKAEILALRHWVGTEKENALRPMLERTIASNPKGAPVSQSHSGDEDINKLRDMISEKLGFNLEDDLWLVSGANKETLNDPIYNASAPDIPTIKDPMARYVDEFDDPNAAAMAKLALQTGLDERTLSNLSVRVLVRNFVTNQTRMGKIQSIYVLSVAGNGNGWLGIGEGKSEEFEDAYIQSKIRAIRGMKPIHRYEGRTIYGEVNGKVGGTTVQLSSRPPGKHQHGKFNGDIKIC
jgi:small subunit ribosomal protein S5